MKDPLAVFPRVSLAHLPTPLEPLKRLSEAVGGPEIWVKRDDCTGLGFGGNKTRKLEFLMAEALADGASTVITVGGVQSNHARQTAAAAARLGLRCELVLPRVVPRDGVEYEQGGNILLDELFGAAVFVVDDEAAAAREIQQRLLAAEARGEHAVVHPPGGSTPTGALGYVAAALELDEQIAAGTPAFEAIYVAAGTGGTVAGLTCGLRLAGREIPVRAVCVAEDADTTRAAIARLTDAVGEQLGLGGAALAGAVLDDSQLAPGYGLPNPATREAVELCARCEGLLLDPVYTGKAVAALIRAARQGELGSGPVLFWHTGGAPALFAYRDWLEQDD